MWLKPAASPAPKRMESPPQAQIAPGKPKTRCAATKWTKPRPRLQVSPVILTGKPIIFAAITAISSLTKIRGVMCTRKGQAEGGVSKTGAAAKNAKDPVCSLEVAEEAAKRAGRTSEYQGKTYYFDTDGCKQRFDRDPQRYLSGSSGATSVSFSRIRMCR